MEDSFHPLEPRSGAAQQVVRPVYRPNYQGPVTETVEASEAFYPLEARDSAAQAVVRPVYRGMASVQPTAIDASEEEFQPLVHHGSGARGPPAVLRPVYSVDSGDRNSPQDEERPPDADDIMAAEFRAAEAREARERMLEEAAVMNALSAGAETRKFAEVNVKTKSDRIHKLRKEAKIPLQFVLDRLQLKLDSSELYLDLCIYLPFLVMFIFFFLYGRDTESNYYVMQRVRDQIERSEHPSNTNKMAMFRTQMDGERRLWVELDKDYSIVGNQGDWSTFLMDVIINTTFDSSHPDRSKEPSELLRTKGNTVLIGAIRLRTIRVRPDSCAMDSDVVPSNHSLFPSSCFAIGFSSSDEDTSPLCPDTSQDVNGDPLFKYYRCGETEAGTGIPTVGVEGVYHCGGYMFELPFRSSYSNVMAIASNATGTNDCGFCDQWSTRFVVMEWFEYCPVTDSFLSIKYFQEVDTAGWWRLSVNLQAFQLWSPRWMGQTVFDGFFLLFVMYYWAVLIHGGLKAFRDKYFVAYVVQMWNLFELANLLCFSVVIGVRYAWIKQSKEAGIALPFTDRYPPHLDTLQYLYYTQLLANSINTLLTFLKLLKYVRLNAQLGILTQTLAVCQQSIVGVLVLFVLIVLSYAVAGWAIYGVNMEEYRSLGVAFSSSFRLLVGDSNYSDMRITNRFVTPLYFWSFLILGLFLLLNFIIAIVSDSFAKISGRAFDQSMEELLLRYYQNMKAFLRLSNLQRLLRGIMNGNSEPMLIRQVISMLEVRKAFEEERIQLERDHLREEKMLAEERKYEYDPLLDDDEDVVVWMMHEYFERWVDADVYALLSSHFFDYTWDEMMNDFDDAKKSNEEEDKRDTIQLVENVVGRVLGDGLTKVELLDAMLTKVEEMIVGIIGDVERIANSR